MSLGKPRTPVPFDVRDLRVGDIVERVPGPSKYPLWRHTITELFMEKETVVTGTFRGKPTGLADIHRPAMHTMYEDGLKSPRPSSMSLQHMQAILNKPGTMVFRAGCLIWPGVTIADAEGEEVEE